MPNPPNGFDPLQGINLQQPAYPVQVPMRIGYKPTTNLPKVDARLPTTHEKIPFNNNAYLDVVPVQTRPLQPLFRGAQNNNGTALPNTTVAQPTVQGMAIDPATNTPVLPTLAQTQQTVPYPLYQNPNPITQGTNMGARDYFNTIKGIDAGALINNIVQAPPPNIQMPLTHLQRVQLDRGQIDNMAEQTREQQAAAYRNMRENVSQSSDFMRGVEAINKSSAEAQRQVGAEYANMNNQEMQMNNQIANQEQQIQDGQNLQEQMTNYELQAKAKAEKNAAITSNLTEIKKDSMAETQYNIMQQDQMRQQQHDKDYIDKDLNIKLLQMKREASLGYQGKPEYAAERKAHLSASMEQYHKELVKGTPFENTKWQDMAMVEDQHKNLAEKLSLGEKYKAEITRLDTAKASAKTDEEKAAIDEKILQYKNGLSDYESKVPELQKMYNDYDKYIKGRDEKYSATGLSAQFDEEYRKKNKIMTTADYMQRIEDMARGITK